MEPAPLSVPGWEYHQSRRRGTQAGSPSTERLLQSRRRPVRSPVQRHGVRPATRHTNQPFQGRANAPGIDPSAASEHSCAAHPSQRGKPRTRLPPTFGKILQPGGAPSEADNTLQWATSWRCKTLYCCLQPPLRRAKSRFAPPTAFPESAVKSIPFLIAKVHWRHFSRVENLWRPKGQYPLTAGVLTGADCEGIRMPRRFPVAIVAAVLQFLEDAGPCLHRGFLVGMPEVNLREIGFVAPPSFRVVEDYHPTDRRNIFHRALLPFTGCDLTQPFQPPRRVLGVVVLVELGGGGHAVDSSDSESLFVALSSFRIKWLAIMSNSSAITGLSLIACSWARGFLIPVIAPAKMSL